MVVSNIVYPATGRGAWSNVGGTLSGDGLTTGRYYRAPAGTSVMPGTEGYKANRDNTSISINQYAVWKAVQAIQIQIGASPDGLFGNDTAAAVKNWQTKVGTESDGIFGPASSKIMFMSLAVKAARLRDIQHPILEKLVIGHTGYESLWDPGAVGSSTPTDLGLCQINGGAHPELTVDFRLNPILCFPWIAGFIDDNLKAFNYREDDAIAAYNLGQGGTRSWINSGRPDVIQRTTGSTYIRVYINAVKKEYS